MNEFVPVERGWPSHSKTFRLKRSPLGYAALGHLVVAWCNAIEHAQNGRVPPEELEDIAEWTGEPGVLLAALVDARFYDPETGELKGWMKRAGVALQKIAEAVEKKREADRERVAARRGVSQDVASCRNVSQDVAPSRDTETETETERGGGAARQRAEPRPLPAARVKTAALDAPTPDELATIRGLVHGVMGVVGIQPPAHITDDHERCARELLKAGPPARVLEIVAGAVGAKPRLREKVPSLFVPRFVGEDWPKFQAAAPPPPGKPAAVSPAKAARAALNEFRTRRAVELEQQAVARGEALTPSVTARITEQVAREWAERQAGGARAGPAPGGGGSSTDPSTVSTLSTEEKT